MNSKQDDKISNSSQVPMSMIKTMNTNKMEMESMDMSMTFNYRLPLSLLFENVKLHSVSDLTIACVLLFVLGVLYESVKCFRIKLHDPNNSRLLYCCSCPKKLHLERNKSLEDSRADIEMIQGGKITIDCENINLTKENQTKIEINKQEKFQSVLIHVIETGLHAIQLFLSYIIMLAVMTYNVFIVVCIIAGCTIGYLVLNWPSNYRKLNRKKQELFQSADCH